MNKNIFTALTVALILIIGIIIWMNFQSVTGTFSDSGFGIKSDKIKTIEIQTKDDHRIFVKKDTTWFIQKPIEEMADQEKINSLLSEFTNSKLVAPVSSNPEKQHVFGVDSSSGKIRFDDQTFYIGNVGPDFKTTFVRQSGSDQVNIFTGLLGSNLTTNIDQFRYRQILNLKKKSVKSITFTGLSENYTFLNDSTGWMMNGKSISSDKTNPLDETLFSLKGETVIDSIKINDLKKYPNSLSLTLSADKNYLVSFYKIPEKLSYFAVQDGSDRIYSVPEYLVDRFFKPSSYWLTSEGKQ